MKKIALLATGGTISTALDPEGLGAESEGITGVIPALGAKQLLTGINGYLKNIEVVPIDVSKSSSRNMSPADIWRLGLAVERCYELGVDGIVIAHGTDTLEETAYGLSLILQRVMPVVLTGAMVSPVRPGADGEGNLIDAIIAAGDDRLISFGPVVSFQTELFPARYVTKASSTRTDAFSSPFSGPIARVVEDRVHFFVQKLNFDDYLGPIPEPDLRVDIVLSYTGSDGLILKLLADHVDGLVIAGTGGGHVTEAMAISALELVKAKIPVVITSRSFDGLVLRHTYGGIGSEIHLRENGVLSGGDLSAIKARLKLLFGLQAGLEPEQLFP